MDYGRIIAQSVSTGSIKREERGRGNEAARVPLEGECKYAICSFLPCPPPPFAIPIRIKRA